MSQIISTIADFRLYPQQSKSLIFEFSLPADATGITAFISFHVRQVDGHGFSIFDGDAYASTKQIFGATASYFDRDYTIQHTERNGFRINPGDTNHHFFMRMDNGGEDYYYFTQMRLTINYTDSSHSITTGVSPAGSGTLTANKASAAAGEQITLTPTPATGYHFSSYTSVPAVSISNNRFSMPGQNISVTANFAKTNYTVSTAVSPTGGGSLTASKTSNAQMGDTITLTPSPAAGYQFSHYTTSPALTINNNTFTMPAGNVTVTAVFTKITYAVTKTVSPSGGGTCTTSASSAVMGTTITLGNTAASGYVFDHYTVNGNTISGNSFTMPAGNAAVVAYFNKLTTGTISTTELTPGVNAAVTLAPGDNSFTHEIVMSFGSNTKTWTAAAGVRSVNVSPEVSWCNSIPNASRMTGGTMIVKTKKGGTVIGQTIISSALAFNVPSSGNEYYPSATTSVYILRTVDGHTYPSVGNIFVQGKCGAEVRLTNPAGAYGSTVTATVITVVGYTGEDFHKDGTGAITLQSGLLINAGTLKIQTKVTDSRGRSMTYTNNYQVYAYSEPSAVLNVFRCDVNGDADPNGLYAKYEYSTSFSAVGSNTLTRKLSIDGHELTLADAAGNGWVLGNDHMQFPILEAHDLYLELTDAFITKTVSMTIPSQRFLIHFSADGTSVAIGQTASTGSKRFTIAQDMTMYIGSRTLEQYIHDVMGQ